MSSSEIGKIRSTHKNKKRKCTIEGVYTQSPEQLQVHPLLVSFRTSRPQNCDLTAIIEREPFKQGQSLNHEYRSALTISTDDGRQYVGENALLTVRTADETLLIGLLDKTTGIMKLVEVEQFTVSRKLDETAQQKLLYLEEEDMPETNLNVMFGTKKNLIKHNVLMQEKERHSVKVLTAIESAAGAVDTTVDPILEGDADGFSYIVPPCNEQAATPMEVYSMESLVGDPILECLLDEAIELIENPISESTQLNPLTLMSVSSAKLEVDEDARMRNTCAALYMRLLTSIVAGHKPKNITDKTLEKFLNTNYKANAKFCPDSYKDRALAHLLILAMLVNKCSVPLAVILGSVAVTRAKLLIFVKVLRLKMSRGNLKLLLPLPSANVTNFKRFKLSKQDKRR